MSKKSKWYQKVWLIILSGFFIPPLGIILALIKPQFSVKKKITVSLILTLWLVLILSSSPPDTKTPVNTKDIAKKEQKKVVETKKIEEVTEKPKINPISKPKSKPAPKEKWLNQDEAESALINIEAGDGIWGKGDGDIEMITTKHVDDSDKGYYSYLVQTRLSSKDKFIDGTVYWSIGETISTMESGANITKFKLWVNDKVKNP